MAPFAGPYVDDPSLGELSPLAVESLLKARNQAQTPNYTPGTGTVSPTTINNNAVFALFGILGAGIVITSIWFFFWAKNGGFRWKKRDWDDYKSTVLRRKGPNGTILSGATKSTRLGDGSVVGSLGSMEEYKDIEKSGIRGGGGSSDKKKAREKQVKNSQDKDVRAYRNEKPARVGGLNREADGSHHDTTNTEPSVSHGGRPHRSERTYRQSHRAYVPATESNISGASDDSRRPLRAERHSNNTTQHGQHRPIRQVPRSTNNRYSSRMSNSGGGSYADPLDFGSQYDGSVGDSEQARNTKAYHHPIPGLSKNTMPGGFRRGGGRRDSLSDSDGETRRS